MMLSNLQLSRSSALEYHSLFFHHIIPASSEASAVSTQDHESPLYAFLLALFLLFLPLLSFFLLSPAWGDIFLADVASHRLHILALLVMRRFL